MADETKRTVPREGRDAAPERGKANGSITFYCTNGHRISVSSSLAGKRGTCSKCGIALRIPLPGPSAGPSGAAAPPAATATADDAAAEDQPGEEKATAAGPDFSGLPSAEDQPDTGGSAPENPPADEGTELQRLFEAVTDGRDGSNASVEAVESSVHAAGPAAAEDAAEPYRQELASNPTAQLVARLWAEREHGGIVELHLTGGSVILPEWYEPAWSRGTHGLFASQAADGTVTLTAVAWESIQKVVVRQVEGLPDGMFE